MMNKTTVGKIDPDRDRYACKCDGFAGATSEHCSVDPSPSCGACDEVMIGQFAEICSYSEDVNADRNSLIAALRCVNVVL
jgi:hypothetical protein